jgi:hypothetical protein
MVSLLKVSNRKRCLGLGVILTLLTLSFSVAVFAQSSDPSSSGAPSLGDLARKQRQKEQAKDAQAKPKKVLTDEDLPSRPDDSSPGATSESSDEPHADAAAAPAGEVMRTGEQWKEAISQSKSAIAQMKGQIDKLQDSIHFVEANAYRNGVEYNKVQAHKQQEVQRAQGQLAEMQKNLEEMQEAARKQGFGSAVWDP